MNKIDWATSNLVKGATDFGMPISKLTKPLSEEYARRVMSVTQVYNLSEQDAIQCIENARICLAVMDAGVGVKIGREPKETIKSFQ